MTDRQTMTRGVHVAPLFVPGDRPDRVEKARNVAGTVIIDLEDAIPPARKPAARAGLVEALGRSRPTVTHWVRVNPITEPDLLEADLRALASAVQHVDAIVLPKVRSVEQLEQFHLTAEGLLGTRMPVVATIEDAVGVHSAWDIAAGPRVLTLLFGTVDLSADLGISATPEGTELLAARSIIVMACAAAGTAPPIDGPHTTLGDESGLSMSSEHAHRLGFGGKIALHPAQLGPIRAAFAPTPEQLEWAQRVVTAYDDAVARGIGVVRLEDGTFIDVPVATRAHAILGAARGPHHQGDPS